MRRTRLFALLLLAPLLAHCAGGDPVRIVPPERVTTSTRDAGQAAALISAYRRSRGLGTVVTTRA